MSLQEDAVMTEHTKRVTYVEASEVETLERTVGAVKHDVTDSIHGGIQSIREDHRTALEAGEAHLRVTVEVHDGPVPEE